MRFPGRIEPGTVVEDPASTMDLFATILDYLGVDAPSREGYSLRGESPDFRVSEWNGANVPNFMVRTRDWKLIMAKNQESKARDALFHLREDPFEMRNVLGAHRERAEELKERLLSWLERAGSPQRDTVRARKI
jgi:arylsulfatase A-like enzyme